MSKSALLLVDIQNDYFPSFSGSKMSLPDMDNASENAAKLLASAREKGVPVIHVRHNMPSSAAPFFHPGTPGAELHESVKPLASEKVIDKTKPNSFAGTDLESHLRAEQIDQITVCGAMSQMCIDATARAASDMGFNVTVAHDACAAASVTYNDVNVPAESVHASIMAPLASSYADVRPTSECTF
ncbi:MAG: cysteine hydrolase family protein [Pseudomonadota bacterium]